MEKETLYHATPARLLAKIMADGCIKPASETGERIWRVRGESEKANKVYLASKDKIRDIASCIQGEYGGTVHILEVEVDSSNLVSDEDTGKDNYRDSLSTKGVETCAHLGSIRNWKVVDNLPYDLSEARKKRICSKLIQKGKTSPEQLDRVYNHLLKFGRRREKRRYSV